MHSRHNYHLSEMTYIFSSRKGFSVSQADDCCKWGERNSISFLTKVPLPLLLHGNHIDILLLFISFSLLNELKLKGMSVLQMKSFPEVRFEFFQPCFIYGYDKAIFYSFLSSSSFFCTSIATSNSSLIRRRLLPPSPPPVRPNVARESYVAVYGAKVFLLSMLTALDTCGVLSLHTLRSFLFLSPFLLFFLGRMCEGRGGGTFSP